MNEEFVKKLQPHPLAYFFYYLGGGLIMLTSLWFGAINFFIGLFIVLLTEIIRRAESFLILETGVSREFKFVSTVKTFAEYEKIQDIKVSQNLVDRIFGIGNVFINTAGSPSAEIIFRGIKNPYEVDKIIQEKLEQIKIGKQ
jgi:uncharacterized membrane protein YdbT with pleckstrin-like domain